MPFITEDIWQKVRPLASPVDVDATHATGSTSGNDRNSGSTSGSASVTSPAGTAGIREGSRPGGAADSVTLREQRETIMLAPYPVADSALDDPDAEAEIRWVQQFILGVRRIKGEMNIAPSKQLPVLIANAQERDLQWLEQARPYLDFLARTESVRLLDDESEAPESAIGLVGAMKILIPMAGLIDKDAELKRPDKEIAKLSADIERIEKKLANPSFVDKAPAAVVQKDRDRAADQQGALANLSLQRQRIAVL